MHFYFFSHIRSSPDPEINEASWPVAFQTALHLYVDGNNTAEDTLDTTPGKKSER